MKKLFYSGFLLLVSQMAVPPQALSETLRQTYENYAEAMEKGDFQRVQFYLSSAMLKEIKDEPSDREREQKFRLIQSLQIPLSNTEFVEEKTEGSQATLELKTRKPQLNLFGTAGSERGKVRYVQENGIWKIDKIEWKSVDKDSK